MSNEPPVLMNLQNRAFAASQPAANGDPQTGGGAAGKKRSPQARSAATSESADRSEPSVRVVRSATEFGGLREAWSRLHERLPAANVFMSHEWLHAWWSSYRPAAELAVVLVERTAQLVAIAPMMIVVRHRAGVTCRVLRFVGDGTGETDHIDFLVEPDQRHRVMPQLLDALTALDWDIAEFNQIPEQSANAQALLNWMDGAALRRSVVLCACPVRRLPATVDAVLAALPARLRTAVRSSRRKLQASHRVEFGLHDRADELDAALSALYLNHAGRWQGKGQAGVFADPRRRAFYARLAPALLRRGWLRFYHLKLDGRIVAQQFCFAVDDTVMLLQEGFDFAHAKDNLGNVLRAFVFEHLVRTGATCYDFLAGSSRHKASWSNAVVNDLRITCARRSWRGWLFHALPQAWLRAKERLRPWRDRLRGILSNPADDA